MALIIQNFAKLSKTNAIIQRFSGTIMHNVHDTESNIQYTCTFLE